MLSFDPVADRISHSPTHDQRSDRSDPSLTARREHIIPPDHIFDFLPDHLPLPDIYNEDTLVELPFEHGDAPSRDPYHIVGEARRLGLTIDEVTATYHVSNRTFRGWKWCIDHGVLIEHRLAVRANKRYTEAERRETAEAAGRDGLVDTMYRTGVNDRTIQLWAAEFCISLPRTVRTRLAPELRDQVVAEAPTSRVNSLHHNTGVSRKTIYRWKKEAGLQGDRTAETRRTLLAAFSDGKQYSVRELMVKTNCSERTVRKYARQLVSERRVVEIKCSDQRRYALAPAEPG